MNKPVFFDLQVNGFAGVDFQSPELTLTGMQAAVAGLERHRTHGILATLITDSVEALCRKLENLEALRKQDSRVAAMVKGYHLEGPWISTEAGFHGAHSKELACPARLEDFQRLFDASGGNLKLITLAPEVEGTIEAISSAVTQGVRIGLGHTNAGADSIDAAIQAGATLATHLGNAVPLEIHRHDNVVQRLLARDELIACLIPDKIHLPAFVLQNFFRAKPQGKVFFTTDCMAAAGMPPGLYSLAGYELEVGEDGIVHLPGDDRFAGSSLTMDAAYRNVIDCLGLEEGAAEAMCSSLPAEHFGIRVQAPDC
ncbi:hypothetical protein [Pelagicoccus sp. SDUM812005]|uniref:N-acetylglucosamine-6-phosphate deacetylase n=1 Tax=Pelagicoccus sp. SDUM812005 TaxID=3041257 RepID=UPI00280CC963|nr:hypothetical protein [Pelagicoccus sp. SDUM812005]MDQ8183666.1 hypothetical protein [Pelagicoccus sp. SDUM812005]